MSQNPQIDPSIAQYIFQQTGIPTGYTQGLEGLGYLGNSFGGVQGSFQSQQQFQRLLKDIMDQQMHSFGFDQPNINALPYDMRSLFNAAAPLMTDALYGIKGANGMLSNGYAYGSLPNNPTRAWDIWQGQQQTPYSPVTGQGYPNYPAPAAGAFASPSSASPTGTISGGGQSSGGGGGGGGGGGSHVGQFDVPLQGGGSIRVNANSQDAAIVNAHQGGNTPDPNGQVTVVHAPVG